MNKKDIRCPNAINKDHCFEIKRAKFKCDNDYIMCYTCKKSYVIPKPTKYNDDMSMCEWENPIPEQDGESRG